MSLLCRKNMTPLQRRAYRWMSVALLLTVVANVLTADGRNPLARVLPFLSALAIAPGHATAWKLIVAVVVMLFPVLLAVFVAARYLAQEPDEFIRALLTRALLWGVACTMAADAIATVVMAASGQTVFVALLNADVLFLSTMVSFRLVTWSYSR